MIYLSQADGPGREPVEIEAEPLHRQMLDLLQSVQRAGAAADGTANRP